MTDGADWGRPRNPGSLRLLVLFGGCLIGCSAEPDSSDHRVDADQDCFYADEDCDDTNASVFPDAPDVWYDGVDSDCAGNDDFDADGDGVRSPAGGGSDWATMPQSATVQAARSPMTKSLHSKWPGCSNKP